MPRCPIVIPGSVRLSLADVHRRAHRALEAAVIAGTATPAELDVSLAAIAAAEADGDWIDVKRQLNTGEHRKMITDQYKETALGNGLSLDLNKFGMSRVLAYVLGWSFVDLAGKPLAFSQGALESCDYDAWQDMLAAVDAHHTAAEADLEARKKNRGDASRLSVTSPSPSAVTGPSMPSVN